MSTSTMRSFTSSMMSFLYSSLRLRTFILTAFVGTLASTDCVAAIFLKGSIAATDTNAELKNAVSRSGSATVAVGLGRYIRLGYTHRQKIEEVNDWVANQASANAPVVYQKSYSKTHETSNSIDLTLILYEGELFTPFLMAGAVVKAYTFNMEQGGYTYQSEKPLYIGPVPNLGAGMSIRLNKDFGLELSYMMSQGIAQKPGEKSEYVWDKYTSLGLTYQL